MDSLIGVLIFIVVVILSLASKAQESRKIAQRQREKELRKPQQLSGKARQQIHGRSHQPKTATPREGAAPPPVPPERPVRKPKPVEQELLETLFGVKFNKEEEQEVGRQPERQPQVRQETQQMVQRLRGESEAEARRAQPRRAAPQAPVYDGDEGPTITVDDIRSKEKDFQKKIRGLRERMHQGMREGLAQTPSQPERRPSGQRTQQQRTQQRRPAAKPVRAVRPQGSPGQRLFATREDIRQAIVASEILGQPKSMRKDEAAA